MLEICIQTSYDQNVQLILKSYLPVVYGTTLSESSFISFRYYVMSVLGVEHYFKKCNILFILWQVLRENHWPTISEVKEKLYHIMLYKEHIPMDDNRTHNLNVDESPIV
jgi:hypothetical protein